jgi:hypothetical protein
MSRKTTPEKAAEQGGGKHRRQGAAYRQSYPVADPVNGRAHRVGARCSETAKEALIDHADRWRRASGGDACQVIGGCACAPARTKRPRVSIPRNRSRRIECSLVIRLRSHGVPRLPTMDCFKIDMLERNPLQTDRRYASPGQGMKDLLK